MTYPYFVLSLFAILMVQLTGTTYDNHHLILIHICTCTCTYLTSFSVFSVKHLPALLYVWSETELYSVWSVRFKILFFSLLQLAVQSLSSWISLTVFIFTIVPIKALLLGWEFTRLVQVSSLQVKQNTIFSRIGSSKAHIPNCHIVCYPSKTIHGYLFNHKWEHTGESASEMWKQHVAIKTIFVEKINVDLFLNSTKGISIRA